MTRSDRHVASDAELEAMIEQATVDCYNEDEQATGLLTMIEGNLALPFQTTVLGVTVSVDSIDLANTGQIVAVCSRDGVRQAVPILDLPMPTPPPSGAGWIEPYRRWNG